MHATIEAMLRREKSVSDVIGSYLYHRSIQLEQNVMMDVLQEDGIAATYCEPTMKDFRACFNQEMQRQVNANDKDKNNNSNSSRSGGSADVDADSDQDLAQRISRNKCGRQYWKSHGCGTLLSTSLMVSCEHVLHQTRMDTLVKGNMEESMKSINSKNNSGSVGDDARGNAGIYGKPSDEDERRLKAFTTRLNADYRKCLRRTMADADSMKRRRPRSNAKANPDGGDNMATPSSFWSRFQRTQKPQLGNPDVAEYPDPIVAGSTSQMVERAVERHTQEEGATSFDDMASMLLV